MKRKEIITIFIFLLIIGTSYIVWPFFRKYVDTENHEKRELATKPIFSISEIATFPKQYEEFINDHIPFRNQLIRTNSLIEYYVFHASSSDRVAVGNDGWLFYIDKNDDDPLSCYKGTNLLNEKQLKQITKNLITTRDNLKKKGIEFVVFIAPNRERIYDKYMPWYYGNPAENYAVLQIYNYIKDNTDIRIVYPYFELKDAARELEADAILYHKTDTHWNELGAYIGARELLDELEIEIPAYSDQIITITEQNDRPGDMAEFLNVSNVIDPGKTYIPTGYKRNNIKKIMYDLPTYIRYEASEGDSRKLFVNRDSFCTAMSDVLGSQFQSSIMVYRGICTNEMIEEEDPDIYVLEMVERNVPEVLQSFVYE